MPANTSSKTNQKINLLTETWFFRKDQFKVKSFEDTKDLGASKIISSITKIDGTYGTQTMQNVLGRICSEWFPSSSYELVESPEILWNESPDTGNPKYRSESGFR